MTGLGERGYLHNLSGLLLARPKARAIFGREPDGKDRPLYRATQREVLLREFRRYNKSAPVVMNLDFGHTKPQIPLPLGRSATIDLSRREVWFSF